MVIRATCHNILLHMVVVKNHHSFNNTLCFYGFVLFNCVYSTCLVFSLFFVSFFMCMLLWTATCDLRNSTCDLRDIDPTSEFINHLQHARIQLRHLGHASYQLTAKCDISTATFGMRVISYLQHARFQMRHASYQIPTVYNRASFISVVY